MFARLPKSDFLYLIAGENHTYEESCLLFRLAPSHIDRNHLCSDACLDASGILGTE